MNAYSRFLLLALSAILSGLAFPFGGHAAAAPSNGPPRVVNFRAPSYSVGESAGSVVITVGCTAGTTTTIVHFATSPGSATAGTDFVATNGTLLFFPFQTNLSFSVTILPDEIPEGDENFSISLNNPDANSVISGANPATVTILDDDAPASIVRFTTPTYYVIENVTGGQAEITVSRSGSLSSTISVGFATGSGTATAGQDYTPVSSTLSFGPGVAQASFFIPLINDSLPEPEESVPLLLHSPSPGVTFGSPSNAVLIIQDSSARPPADLGIRKTANPGVIRPGETVSFQLVLSNAGPASADAAIVEEILPAGLRYVAASGDGTYDSVNGQWHATALSPGSAAFLSILCEGVAEGNWTNSARILPNGSDLNPANDFAFADVKVEPPEADLALFKTANTNLIEITNKVLFTLSVTNLGPSPATNIVVTDSMPTALTIDAAEAPTGSLWRAATRTWTITNLSVGTVAELKLTVSAAGGGAFTNQAAITSSTPADPVQANNTAKAEVTVFGYAICGSVTLCDGGGPAHTNAVVKLMRGATLLQTIRTDDRGTFCFTNLPPETYKVIVTPADPATGIQPVDQEVALTGETRGLLLASPWPILTGKVLFRSGGPPVANIEITAEAQGVKNTVTTDAAGVYRFVGLTAAEYTVTPTPTEGVTFFPASAKVGVGLFGSACPAGTNFVLSGKLRISGRLTACAANGPTIPYATVTLSRIGFPDVTTLSGPDGTYVFTNLPPATYTLAAAHPTHTFNPASQEVKLTTRSLVTAFVGAPNNIIGGKVLSHGGDPLADIEVTIATLPNGANPRKVRTDAKGEFTFPNLPNGNFGVTLTPPNAAFTFTPGVGLFQIPIPGNCQSYVVFRTSENAVEIAALEVVQVIQDWQNTAPLVEGKRTLVRAFLKPAGTNQTPVTVSAARLVARQGTTTETVAPSRPVVARSDFASRRNAPETSLAFELPPSMTRGEVSLTLQWPKGILTTDKAPPEQTAVDNNQTSVTFRKLNDLPIQWVKVHWVWKGTTHTAKDALINQHAARLRAALPTARVSDARKSELTWKPSDDPADLLVVGNDKDLNVLRNELQRLLKRKRVADEFAPDRSAVIYYGVLTDSGIGGQAGAIPSKTAFGDMSPDPVVHRNLAPHELGHTLGRHHAVHSSYGLTVIDGVQVKNGACREIASGMAPDYPMDQHETGAVSPTLGPMRLGSYKLAYGWDGSDGTYVSPFETADVMSYCVWKSKWVWPGIYTYTNIFNEWKNRFGPLIQPAPAFIASAAPPQTYLLISGFTLGSNQPVQLDPVAEVIRQETPPPPTPGDYTLLIYNRAGQLASSTPFAMEHGSEAPASAGFFVLEAPRPSDLGSIQVVQGPVTLANLSASSRAPVVQVFQPIPGTQPTNESIRVQWSASDPDGDPLYYTVQFRPHLSDNWQTLVMDLTETEFVIPGPLAGTRDGTIRVVASDGLNSAMAEAGPLAFQNLPPHLIITSPVPMSLIAGEATLILSAEATDPEEGQLPSESIQWSSDLSGNLGNGSELSLAATNLAEGLHTITARTVDAQGASGIATVPVEVRRLVPVPFEIHRINEDELELRWPISASTLQVFGAFTIDATDWFLVLGERHETDDQVVVRLPYLGETIFYRLGE